MQTIFKSLLIFLALEIAIFLLLFFTLYTNTEPVSRILCSLAVSFPLSTIASIISFFIFETKKTEDDLSERNV